MKSENNYPYTGKDIAFLIPTRNRPEKLSNFLESLASQTENCGRVIVVASGDSVEHVVSSFSAKLPIEYYHTESYGQIFQRNFGKSQLDDRSRLVATMDDDIVLNSDAVEKMVCFWNSVEAGTAGVGFNIDNKRVFSNSPIRRILGLSGKQAGLILKSGYNTPVVNVVKSIRVQWLNGGATVWRQDILLSHPHREIKARWANCEDMIFSYPIGKKYPLYICAESKAIHDHCFVQIDEMNIFRYRGKVTSLWLLYFVKSNSDLSLLAFVRSTVLQSCLGILKAVLFTRNRSIVEQNIGRLGGLIEGISALIMKRDLISVLED